MFTSIILFLAVLATAPPFDTSLSLWAHLQNLCLCVCFWCYRDCSERNRDCSERKGVYSDREEAEEGGNITAINIKMGRSNFITHIRVR